MIDIDFAGPSPADIEQFRSITTRRMEKAALATVAKVAPRGRSAITRRFAGAGLQRLGNAIGAKADRTVHRRSGNDFSASAQFFARSRSERTLGALESYTQGAQILPKRGRWLWIATPEGGRLIGRGDSRRRISPEAYRENGEKLGPLIFIKSVNGSPLLAVQNVGVSATGARGGRARPLKKSGGARKGDRARELVVLFIGIPRTARAARIDLTAILTGVQRELPVIFEAEHAKVR